MDSQIVTVDQFAAAMASIQEAIAGLYQMIDGQQAQQVLPQDGAQYDYSTTTPSTQSVSTTGYTFHSA